MRDIARLQDDGGFATACRRFPWLDITLALRGCESGEKMVDEVSDGDVPLETRQ
jgi:hypothetical protein